MNKLFGTLYNKALEGDKDCGGLLAYNYFSGEHITGFEEGRPMFVRTPDSKFSLANFMRANLYTSLGALKVGLDILLKAEEVAIDRITGHGGLFKTKGVGQKILAAAMDATVSAVSYTHLQHRMFFSNTDHFPVKCQKVLIFPPPWIGSPVIRIRKSA